ncbi:unnamed protein product [Allacma fusca]|uniref:Shootin-1 n=1 Tax=Allacma fusca TaxID=39272 RepID=A0A8J2JWG0_9HEXA|nr:unnamed protein product [Allacma fusca]
MCKSQNVRRNSTYLPIQILGYLWRVFQNQSSENLTSGSYHLSKVDGETRTSSSSCVKFSNGAPSTTNIISNGDLFRGVKSPTPQSTSIVNHSPAKQPQPNQPTDKPDLTTIMSNKKTSLSINLTTQSDLNGNSNTTGNSVNHYNGIVSRGQNNTVSATTDREYITSPSSTKPGLQCKPRPRSPTKTLSSIPKPTASVPVTLPNATGTSGSRGALWNSNGLGNRNGSTTPTSPSSSTFTNRGEVSKAPNAEIDWKDKFEESEKKRLHIVMLAQKATRDYEELRRRYHDSCTEREKMVKKLEGSTVQLDSLRKASEAAYDEYYKLKKKYDNENFAKAEALTRVDQYNKENRRLKRQSALMMQQLTDQNFAIEEEAEEAESAENDKEISYLRKRIQDLEGKIVELESELEKTKLTEFETQESVMLMNDAVYSSKSETTKLRDHIRKLEQENRKLHDALDDAVVELDNVKGRDVLDQDKLRTAEAELRRVRTEKNILARQSLVFMSDAMDDRLLDALAQIGDLQTAIEDQKNSFRKDMDDLRKLLSEKEAQEETAKIKTEAAMKALEDEAKMLRERAEEAERKLEELPVVETPPPPPPPPPMPMLGLNAPPPPPLPSSLNSSLSSQLKNLKKTTETNSCPDDTSPDGSKSAMPSNPQIDDVVSQIKKGIKLRPMDKTLSRKPTELQDKPAQESHAVEEMRAILNNLKRTRRQF